MHKFHLLLLSLLLSSLLTIQAKADEPSVVSPSTSPIIDVGGIFSKIPTIKSGLAYDIEGSTFDNISTVEILNKWGFSLSGGYSTSDKIVAALDYDIGGLQRFGINVPILDLIDLRVGAYVGMGNISTSNGEDRNKVAWGPEITIVSLKF